MAVASLKRNTDMTEAPRRKRLKGPEKAAILFLCLGESRGSELMQKLDEVEIQKITRAMSRLGVIDSPQVEKVMAEFVESAANGGAIVGSFSVAERLLRNFLPEDQVNSILKDISGPLKERDLWDRFSGINENVIASYLKGEHVQTAAAILSNVKQASDADNQQHMAELLNKFDRDLFEQISPVLEERVPDAFNAIKQKMFTFDDLVKLDGMSLARVMRGVPGNTLPLALRGASKEVRDYFLEVLPGRSRDMLVDEMANMGPVRGKQVREAQSVMVDYAKELAEEEVIALPSDDEDDDFID